MKVIFCKWKSICENGISNAMKRVGIDVVDMNRPLVDVNYDMEYAKELVSLCEENSDAICVFSVNFHPIIARACKAVNKLYFSWIVDCPCFQLYSKTLSYPTNRVFVLDRLQYEKFSKYNPEGVFHLPLGCDVPTWDGIKVTEAERKAYSCDVSFIGSLYSEKTKYNFIEKDLPDRIKGFVEGVISAQLNVFGYNFIEECITDEWALEFKKYADWEPLKEDYIEDIKAIIADTYIGYKCTEQDRIKTFNAIGECYNMDLWTVSDTSMIKNVNVRGGADSNNMMPQIIKCSKINLNLTNKPIKTGLPLRIFDLMGAGGFVISNYQAEIPEIFVPGEDIVLYDSILDLLNKIGYYLEHEEERLQIARNGYNKVKEYHSYDIKIGQMFALAGLI